MSFCKECGVRNERRYHPVGFDSFWGYRVYVLEEKCPNWRWWSLGHTRRTDRLDGSADWFGFTDETIPLVWVGATSDTEPPQS